jgi:two-component system, chemotaxis family, CheB/CheR fusion protein
VPNQKKTKAKLAPRASPPARRASAPPPAHSAPETGLVVAPQSASEPGKGPFCTVGIGASAGGLEALFAFSSALPASFGMAIVIVTHQSADQPTLLTELLARRSALPVVPASEGVELEPDHVYVCPPGKHLALLDGVFHVSDPVHDGPAPRPIDFFFRSLAADCEERAIAIVLSGTGSDGSLGTRAVKAQGGMAFVQDQESAQYPDMPMSAAAAVQVDAVLPPREMPARLMRHARGGRALGEPLDGAGDSPAHLIHAVLALLKRRSGHDFTGYKPSVIARRIARRMRVHQIDAVAEYLALLHSHPHELDLLFSELLISVTSFFRDEEAFRSLATLLGPKLAREPERPFRAWVAACSTGEEAYSLGILLAELSADSGHWSKTQVFGTDIDPNVIDYARLGLYPEGIATDVGAERLERFFVREGNGYRICKSIRERCVFAGQSVIKDPPFTKLDLLSCRNLLIYLDAEAQQRLIHLFHHALEPGGLLLLGTSETINGFDQLFKPVDRKLKIFERLPRAATALSGFDWQAPWPLPARSAPAISTDWAPGSVAAHASLLLLERFVPPTLVVNRLGDILFVHGSTGTYLELNAGEPQTNLLAMAREGLHGALLAGLRRAANDEREIVLSGVPVRSNGQDMRVDVIVQQLSHPDALRGLFRVSLDASQAEPPPARGSDAAGETRGRHAQLERALQRARGALQGSIEELQGSNEELKSANEELQSTNEELQSSNEELQTAKEEQHSMNEEMHAVNLELRAKMEELSRVNDDMANLLDSTDIATLFLDRQLRIKRFTELAREVINLIPGDVGRPITDLVSHLRYDRLTDDARTVLSTLRPHEVEVQTSQGLWRLVRITPYRTSQNVIEGVAISFLDIDRVKRAELLAGSRALTDSVVQTAHEPLVVLDENASIASANPAFLALFGLHASDALQTSLFQVGGGLFGGTEMRSRLGLLLAEGTPFKGVVLDYAASEGRRHLLVNGRGLSAPVVVPRYFLLALDEQGRQ